jgi:hypothetical protein
MPVLISPEGVAYTPSSGYTWRDSADITGIPEDSGARDSTDSAGNSSATVDGGIARSWA